MKRQASGILLAVLVAALAILTLPPDAALSQDKVEGITVPPGLEEDKAEIERLRKFSQDSVNCYKRFVDQKKAVEDKKSKGQALTDQEKVIDGITRAGQMDDWVNECLEALGYKPKTAATTDAFGQVEKESDDRKTPLEAFQDDLTDLHERSHIDGAEQDAKAVGLDWEKWKKHGENQKKYNKARQEGREETDAELRERLANLEWAAENGEKIKAFIFRRADPTRRAEEEMGEYEKEVRVYDRVLQILEKRIKDRDAQD